MAAPGIPTGFNVSQGNRQVAVSWNAVATATSYQVQRSPDGINFTNLIAPAVPYLLDDTVVVGTKYWYKVAGINGDGTGAFTDSQSTVPAPAAELSLFELRLRAQERADRPAASQFVTQAEWNFFINQSMYELYDLLVTASENYFEGPEVTFTSTTNQYLYPLPNGALPFKDNAGNTIIAPPFYKLLGLDLGVNSASNAYVTINRYNLIDRNRYVYPNTSSTIYGVFNLEYAIVGTNIRFIPTPSSGQQIRILYAPRLAQLMLDTDLTTIGYSGWLQYVIVRAAKYALDKEESDTSKLDAEIAFLKKRIEETAENQDQGAPATISDIRSTHFFQGKGGGSGNYGGGY